MAIKNTPQFLRAAFDAALKTADPQVMLPDGLRKVFSAPLKGRCLVVGAGKAAASMAVALEQYAKDNWPEAKLEGMVITRYGHGLPTKCIQVIEAGHPVPDEAGLNGAKETLRLIRTLQPGDQLIALISGGGSSLLTLPAADLSIQDLQITTQALLMSGAPIGQMNIVRKHLSAILGGHMAREAAGRGAKVDAFLISDVTGDHPSSIASGPCAPDESTFADALQILKDYDLLQGQIPKVVTDYLQNGLSGKNPETPKSGDPIFKQINNHLLATAHSCLEAAAKYCESQGVKAVILGDTVMGEAKDVALMQAALAREIFLHDQPFKKPVALLSGGECTVTIPRDVKGRGGRCSEFLLSLYVACDDLPTLSALAADTDGIDGSEDNAGAWFASESRKVLNHDHQLAKDNLAKHDSYGFFKDLNTLVHTGPTLTNVNDFRILLIDSES
jgi:hydroxypyruvate reductase